MERLRVGIFGGSFNPIHVGHLALANYLREYEPLDEVWFLVSPHNPLKERGELLDDEFRLSMVRRVVEEYPGFRVSDFEFHLPAPNYMVNTLRSLRAAYPDYDFVLIIGADNWQVFSKWYRYEEILKENEVWIYPRLGCEIDMSALPPGVRKVDTPIIEISSTFIRESIKKGRDVRYFLPIGFYEEVVERIRSVKGNGL